jgi:hypothetical protein
MNILMFIAIYLLVGIALAHWIIKVSIEDSPTYDQVKKAIKKHDLDERSVFILLFAIITLTWPFSFIYIVMGTIADALRRPRG